MSEDYLDSGCFYISQVLYIYQINFSFMNLDVLDHFLPYEGNNT